MAMIYTDQAEAVQGWFRDLTVSGGTLSYLYFPAIVYCVGTVVQDSSLSHPSSSWYEGL